MTARELIAELRQTPPDAEVYLVDSELEELGRVGAVEHSYRWSGRYRHTGQGARVYLVTEAPVKVKR